MNALLWVLQVAPRAGRIEVRHQLLDQGEGFVDEGGKHCGSGGGTIRHVGQHAFDPIYGILGCAREGIGERAQALELDR